jgi:hypothetical protein
MEQKTEKKKVPVVPGWFSLESPFRLIGIDALRAETLFPEGDRLSQP